MRPDNTESIITAARQRHELTRAKAIQALRELEHAGTPMSFQTVATAAGVSRSWLYSQPDIRAEIVRLRATTTQHAPRPPVSTGERISESSALARLEVALQRNRELAEENRRLRRQLAHALGDQRQAPNVTSRMPKPARRHHSSVTIGPC